jgi:hypothetical protein
MTIYILLAVIPLQNAVEVLPMQVLSSKTLCEDILKIEQTYHPTWEYGCYERKVK